MVFIYLIEDMNDLKYVGKTTQKLHDRWRRHVSDKYNPNAHGTSSCKLNMLNSIIYPLEECSEEDSKQREKYWINEIDCVNINTLHCDLNTYYKKYRENNREKKLDSQRKYREKNRESLRKKNREYMKLKREELKNNNL